MTQIRGAEGRVGLSHLGGSERWHVGGSLQHGPPAMPAALIPAPSLVQVDILVMAEPSSGRWVHLDTEITNSSGRITYSVPRPRRLGVGVYPVKMVVR